MDDVGKPRLSTVMPGFRYRNWRERYQCQSAAALDPQTASVESSGLGRAFAVGGVSKIISVVEARAERIADGDGKPSGLSDPPMERRERSITAAGDGAASGLRAKVSLPNGVTLSVELDDASMIGP